MLLLLKTKPKETNLVLFKRKPETRLLHPLFIATQYYFVAANIFSMISMNTHWLCIVECWQYISINLLILKLMGKSWKIILSRISNWMFPFKIVFFSPGKWHSQDSRPNYINRDFTMWKLVSEYRLKEYDLLVHPAKWSWQELSLAQRNDIFY